MAKNKRATGQAMRTPLLVIIEKHPAGITPEELFREAGYQPGEVDEFYQELAEVFDAVTEIRPIAKVRTWPDNKGIVLKPKRAH